MKNVPKLLVVTLALTACGKTKRQGDDVLKNPSFDVHPINGKIGEDEWRLGAGRARLIETPERTLYDITFFGHETEAACLVDDSAKLKPSITLYIDRDATDVVLDGTTPNGGVVVIEEGPLNFRNIKNGRLALAASEARVLNGSLLINEDGLALNGSFSVPICNDAAIESNLSALTERPFDDLTELLGSYRGSDRRLYFFVPGKPWIGLKLFQSYAVYSADSAGVVTGTGSEGWTRDRSTGDLLFRSMNGEKITTLTRTDCENGGASCLLTTRSKELLLSKPATIEALINVDVGSRPDAIENDLGHVAVLISYIVSQKDVFWRFVDERAIRHIEVTRQPISSPVSTYWGGEQALFISPALELAELKKLLGISAND